MWYIVIRVGDKNHYLVNYDKSCNSIWVEPKKRNGTKYETLDNAMLDLNLLVRYKPDKIKCMGLKTYSICIEKEVE